MNKALFFVALGICVAHCNVEMLKSAISRLPKREISEHTWAVLAAGSTGWGNYRHQADVCHTFQELRLLGVPEEHIIVFMADDIAGSTHNPYPGKIFNYPVSEDPTTPDVYEGVPKDYTGDNATVENFMSVMKGIRPQTGSGKFLETTEEDNVFFYYDDHGGTGIVAFPDEKYIHDTDIEEIISHMTENKMYNKLIMFIQACYSASMVYKQTLPKNVYIATSAPVEASAYAFNYDSKLGTYVASRWAYGWVDGAETLGPSSTFQENFDYTWKYTKNYSQGCQFGDLSLTEMTLGEFFNPNSASTAPHKVGTRIRPPKDAVRQCDVPLEIARRRYAANSNAYNLLELRREELYRTHVDDLVRRIIASASGKPHLQTIPCDTCSSSCPCIQNCGGMTETCKFECCDERSCFEDPPTGIQRIIHDCSATLFKAFITQCGKDNHAYLTSAVPKFAMLCRNSPANMDAALEAIRSECSA